jgi:uncharacterized repeat protein (TIGR01451 family)
MRDRIRTERTFGYPAAASRSARPTGTRPQGAAAPVFSFVAAFILFLGLILFSSTAWSATPAGTIISNVANVAYTPGAGLPVTASSPTSSVAVVVVRTPSVIEFLQYGPGTPGAQPVSVGTTSYSSSGTPAGPFAALAPPIHVTPGVGPAAIDLSGPVPLVPATQYHLGEPVFIRLTDGDQNLEPAVRETVLITIQDPMTGDREVLRLLETGSNTGVFTGYVQTAAAAAAAVNGILEVVNPSTVSAFYTDIADATDSRTTSALIDPFGMVFSSATGLPVDGAVVTLIDAVTGLPATVYGDDGFSSFPSAVVSGGTATDSGGKIYIFTPGGYRFPFIAAGTYRLVVTPPAAYRAPSQVPTAVLQALPGGPFAIVLPGSRGEDFIVNPGPAIHIDLPIDPSGGSLWLVKTAGKQTAAVGDFIPYRLTVENASPGVIAGISIADRLPAGFRYRKGSARLNGAAAADPAVSDDGRSLTFSAGTLATGAKADIAYVAEAGAGARLGPATNSAMASNGFGAVSNRAQATVMVVEDLFRSTATIMGRVSVDGCGDRERSELFGLAGVRLFLEDGTFVVTDSKGLFHFNAVTPRTHVVQLDLATVPPQYEVLACEQNTRFAGSPFSQFVDVQGGSLWRADFHLGLRPKQVGEVGIEIMTSPKTPAPGALPPDSDLIEYTVPMHVGTVPARNLKLSIMLPEGGVYQKGTANLAGAPLPSDGIIAFPTGTNPADRLPLNEPDETEGVLTFRFAELPANWGGTLKFDAAVPLSGPRGKQLSTGALLTADAPEGKNNRTPAVNTTLVLGTREELRPSPDIVLRPRFASGSADLTAQDKQDLDRVIEKLRKKRVNHITVTGHTDSQRIRARLLKRYPDNYALSSARAAAVGAYLADGLGLGSDQVTYAGKGPDEPLDTNTTDEGRARNRRVELTITPDWQLVPVPALVSGPPSGMKAVATMGLRPGEEWPREQPAAPAKDKRTMPEYDAAWLAAATPGAAWLWPPEGHHPAIAATKVAVKHDPALAPLLILNGTPVDGIYYDGMTKRQDGTVAVSRWSGVHLIEGDNRFAFVLQDAAGVEAVRIERTFHYSGMPVTARLVPERSRLLADGRATAVIAVQLLDKEGHPAHEGTAGEFSVDPPYLAQQTAARLQQSPLSAPSTDRIRYTVGEDGIALIELAPTNRPGEAVVRLPLERGEQDVRAWIRSESRDWVLVGLAEGTIGYNAVSGNMETLGAAGGEDHYYDEGRLAFYAKGAIKGEWLLTLAYDSAKAVSSGRPSLYQTVDPNKYYVIYGDATEQYYDAASAKKVYVRLERGQFYALFGDFDTGLTMTELSRYSRNLTGLKSELKNDRYEYNLFAADTNQAFVKDEIPGDGTSGLYRLSRRNAVINSETVVIETRDRFHSEVIVSSQPLTRFLDYSIDYDAGTLFFRYPVFSRDANFNPVYIVVRYETASSADLSYNYGGRGAVRFLDRRVEAGATYVHEGSVGGSGDLTGVDATVMLDERTKVRAEVAETRTDQPGAAKDGSAYLAELSHQSARLQGKAYVREQDSGFGLGQQNNTETGTRKMGFDLLYRFTDRVSLGGAAFRQETFSTGAVRDSAEVQARYGEARYDYFGGYRHVEDSFPAGPNLVSDQVYAGVRYQMNDRLTARLQRDQNISTGANSTDYPTRTTLGLDYLLTRDTVVFAAQELTSGTDKDTATTRVGMRTAPWTGMQLSSTMEQQVAESGVRLFSTTGLKQTWQLSPAWTVDAGMDRSATIRETISYRPNPNVPPASGGEDFTAFTVGAGYRARNWSWNIRTEARTSATNDKVGLVTGAYGEPWSGVGLAAAFQGYVTDTTGGMRQSNSDLRLGYAYRPLVTRWIILDRLDFLVTDLRGGTTASYSNWRIVNNFVANYKIEGTGQVSLQYGAKYVEETIDSMDFRGYTDLAGIEGRYDLTKKIDLGLRVSALHSWSIGQVQYGTALSAGFTVAKNFWLSVGYNVAGFQDRDFSKADFTAQGPFIKLRMKFDQVSVGEAVKWLTGQ